MKRELLQLSKKLLQAQTFQNGHKSSDTFSEVVIIHGLLKDLMTPSMQVIWKLWTVET
jgi:hypothetical protein